jgi:hypothetical protein
MSRSMLLALALASLAAACSSTTVSPSTVPHISSISPTSGAIGSSVVILGTNFGATQGSSAVAFNGFPTTPTSWSATTIAATVPSGATTGAVAVTVGGVVSNGVVFTVTAPAAPATTAESSTMFSSTLPVLGSTFYSFDVGSAGAVSLTLASVTPITPAGSLPPPALPVVLGMAFGVPQGTGCSLDQSLETAAGLTVQFITESPMGVHCVAVFDVGNLTGPVNFTVIIEHP